MSFTFMLFILIADKEHTPASRPKLLSADGDVSVWRVNCLLCTKVAVFCVKDLGF